MNDALNSALRVALEWFGLAYFLGHITAAEALVEMERARRLAQAEQLGVRVVAVTRADLALAQIDTPPQASRPLTLRDRIERRLLGGHFEEWKR